MKKRIKQLEKKVKELEGFCYVKADITGVSDIGRKGLSLSRPKVKAVIEERPTQIEYFRWDESNGGGFVRCYEDENPVIKLKRFANGSLETEVI